jgi:hypothetical protein
VDTRPAGIVRRRAAVAVSPLLDFMRLDKLAAAAPRYPPNVETVGGVRAAAAVAAPIVETRGYHDGNGNL